MTFQPDRSPRRSIRLKEYDYTSQGLYFVTICAHQRQSLFGEIETGQMILNAIGQVVFEEWSQTSLLRPNVELDAFVVMPNHVHGIILITDSSTGNVGAQRAAPLRSTNVVPLSANSPAPRPAVSPGSLGAIVRAFKSAAARRINLLRDTPAAPVWQRNYYEHVIRNEDDLNRIRAYIENNPSTWETDKENPNPTGRKL